MVNNKRMGYIFILPQNDNNDQKKFQEFTLTMNGHVFNQIYDFQDLIAASIDRLHEDGFGDSLSPLKYSYEIRRVNSIDSFIKEMNTTKESKNIRILLSDKVSPKTDSIVINGITHVAFIILPDDMANASCVPQVHPNPPLFYQCVASVNDAIISAYSVALDSIMCHAIGMCDYSLMHIDKIGISRDKVIYLRSDYFINNLEKWCNNSIVIEEIHKLRNLLKDDTPYISLLAPLIPLIQRKADVYEIGALFASIWENFLLWYVQIHNKYLDISSQYASRDMFSALSTVRCYSGQINVDEFGEAIRDTLKKKGINNGKEQQVFLVVLRHIPDDSREVIKIAPLFGKNPVTLRQGNWIIATPDTIKNYVGDDNLIVHNMFISTIKEDNVYEAKNSPS